MSGRTASSRHPLVTLESVVLVGIGGFAGANLRFLADTLLPGMGATLAVNALGSLALGFVLYEALYAGVLAEETRFVVSTGFLASFTTYSTFAVQTLEASPVLLIGNVAGNYALGFAGIVIGRWAAGRIEGAR